MPVLDKIEGRFAQILPPKVATPEHRTLAQAMLKVKGVNFAKPGTAVRLTPPRLIVWVNLFFTLDRWCPTSPVMLTT